MSVEQFERGVETLLSVDRGLAAVSGNHPDYYDGFLLACNMWNSGKTPRESFRRVVEARDDSLDNASEETERGYDDALRMFQSAKGLSTRSP